MTISGERTEQLDMFCRVTGFTSDFLSFIVVEVIRFFHGAIQMCFFCQEQMQVLGLLEVGLRHQLHGCILFLVHVLRDAALLDDVWQQLFIGLLSINC